MSAPVPEPIWELTGAYHQFIESFARHDHVKGPWMASVVYSRSALARLWPGSADYVPSAFTLGGVVPLLAERLAVPPEYLNRPIGVVVIEKALEQALTRAEMKFVVAHEYSHIQKNHWPMLVLGPIFSDIASSIIRTIENPTQRAALDTILHLVGQFGGAMFTRQSELDADAHALQLTRNTSAARSTIQKLSAQLAGGNLDAPTHYAMINGMYVGVLTFRDRLNNLP